jgi:RNA polymerase sigma-70 factor (ECF subfamily)
MAEEAKKVSSPSDHLLMTRVREGDVSQLGVLFERYHGVLFNFFLRMSGRRQLSEDLVQEVFVRILKYRATYRDDGNFTTWMYKIARHVRFDDLRKRRPESALGDEDADRHVSHLPPPGERLERDQEARMLRGALARIAPDKREVLILSRYQFMKYEEIAEVLGCGVGAVKVRVYRAIRELREIFFELAGEKAS